MIKTLSDFVAELREIGVPVSMVEAIDAAQALEYTDLADPNNLRATLGATLVKNSRHYRAFDAAFDVFFGLRVNAVAPDAESLPLDGQAAVGGGGETSDALSEAIAAALLAGDGDALRGLVAAAVDRYAGMQPGRPVGGRYYTYRVLRRLDVDELLAMIRAALGDERELSALDERRYGDTVVSRFIAGQTD